MQNPGDQLYLCSILSKGVWPLLFLYSYHPRTIQRVTVWVDHFQKLITDGCWNHSRITHTVKYKFLRAHNHTDSRRVNFYGALFTTMWFAGSLTVDRYLLVDSSNPNHTSIKVQVVIKSWSFCCKPKTLHTWLLFGNICAADGSDSLCEVCDTFAIMWIEILKKTKMLWNGCIARGISLEGCFAVGGDLWRWL